MTTIYVRGDLPQFSIFNDTHDIKPASNSFTRKGILTEATKGSILLSDLSSDKHSPMFGGKVSSMTTKTVDSLASWAENRARFFRETIRANYIGRVLYDPVNIIIGDPDGINVSKYLDIFPDNWWGSVGFFTEYDNNPGKLFTDLEMYLPYSKPFAVTDHAVSLLKTTRLDFVDASGYTLDLDGGLKFRESSLRDESFEFTLEEGSIESR